MDPGPADVRLEDVAAGLARARRFGGHCRQFHSVAHHSLHVSRELPRDDPRLRLVGLLYDAAEAYVGDLPRPIKANVEGFRRTEARIQDAVWEALGLAPPTDAEWRAVDAVDDRLLAYEAHHLLADASWADDPPDLYLATGAVDAVREAFRARAERLLEAAD